jgi:anti-sigma factor RsiW
MADCPRFDPLVTPFIDGALSDADRRAVEHHLNLCPPCRWRVSAERAVRALLHARKMALHAPPAPPALRIACAGLRSRATLEAESEPILATGPARAAAWRTRLAPFALAASLVLLVGGALLYQATDQSSRVMAAELTADHMKCLAMNAVFGTHQSSETVEGAMVSGFGWQMRLPENPSRAGLELVGSRPCLYAEGKVAHIMYRHDGRPVSLFMLPGTVRPQELVEVLGHQAAIWCVGRRTFVLVSSEPKGEVERMASFVRAALR